jgi:hypothetical protein
MIKSKKERVTTKLLTNISFALETPIILGNKREEQPSAQKANFINGVINVASGTAYTTSHNASVVTPKPMAGPILFLLLLLFYCCFLHCLYATILPLTPAINNLGKLINSSTKVL